jgi:lysine 2,3-aminomutase
VLTIDYCAVYCRHCFRRYFSESRAGSVSDEDLNRIVEYLEDHPLVDEIILSGGDPLTLPDDRIENILEALDRKRKRIFRIATRVPVVLPGRITGDLAALLSRFAPVWLVTQFNHPAEITEQSRDAVRTLSSHGIPLLNQAVLLKGINDDPEILKTLFHSLVRSGVKPYYLFQGDLARGTSHFRVPLERALKIVEETEKGLSGIAMPNFALDLPGGGGKIRLSRDSICEKTDEWYILKDPNGNRFRYPREG